MEGGNWQEYPLLDLDGHFVYTLWGEGRLLYVGSSTALASRMNTHLTHPPKRDVPISRVAYLWCEDHDTMVDLEIQLISDLQPPWNGRGKRRPGAKHCRLCAPATPRTPVEGDTARYHLDVIDPVKLRERREAKGLSQGKLSLAAGFARNAVSRIESGARGSEVRLETAVRLAEVLEIEVDELLVKPDPTLRPDYDWRFG